MIASGGEILVTGNVGDNAALASGRIQIDGTINDDANIAGGVIIINGNINDDLRVAAGVVYINSAEINGNLIVAAGEVYIDDDVKVAGERKISAGKVQEGNNEIRTLADAPDKYSFNGKFEWDGVGRFLSIVLTIMKFLFFLGWLIAGILLIWLFRTRTSRVVNLSLQNGDYLGMSLLIGILAFIIAPIIGSLLLIYFIGIPVFFVLALLAIWAMVYSTVILTSIIGTKVLDLFQVKASPYLGFALGALILFVLGFIPVINWFIQLL